MIAANCLQESGVFCCGHRNLESTARLDTGIGLKHTPRPRQRCWVVPRQHHHQNVADRLHVAKKRGTEELERDVGTFTAQTELAARGRRFIPVMRNPFLLRDIFPIDAVSYRNSSFYIPFLDSIALRRCENLTNSITNIVSNRRANPRANCFAILFTCLRCENLTNCITNTGSNPSANCFAILFTCVSVSFYCYYCFQQLRLLHQIQVQHHQQ